MTDSQIKSPDELHEETINNISNDDDRDLLLMHIGHEISKLRDEDVQDHIWWNKFRAFIVDHFKGEGRELTEEETAALDYDPNDESSR